MKKITVIFLIFSFIDAYAQEGVLFKIKYLPEHYYKTDINTGLSVNIVLSGDESLINGLKQQGIVSPLSITGSVKVNTEITTGSTGKDYTIPLKVAYTSSVDSIFLNGANLPLPASYHPKSTMFIGHINAEDKIITDSLTGDRLPDSSKQLASQLMKKLMGKIVFPDHPMKIGESFKMTSQVSLPNIGNNSDVHTTYTYKLESINDGIAIFNVNQTVEGKINIKQIEVNFAGSGDGKMAYNLKDNFPMQYENDVNLKVTGSFKSLNFDGKIEAGIHIQYAVKK